MNLIQKSKIVQYKNNRHCFHYTSLENNLSSIAQPHATRRERWVLSEKIKRKINGANSKMYGGPYNRPQRITHEARRAATYSFKQLDQKNPSTTSQMAGPPAQGWRKPTDLSGSAINHNFKYKVVQAIYLWTSLPSMISKNSQSWQQTDALWGISVDRLIWR